jgi:hypothetical protein
MDEQNQPTPWKVVAEKTDGQSADNSSFQDLKYTQKILVANVLIS